MKRPKYISIFAQDPFSLKTLGGVQWPYSRDECMDGAYRRDVEDVRKLVLKYKWRRAHPLKMRIKFTDVYGDFDAPSTQRPTLLILK